MKTSFFYSLIAFFAILFYGCTSESVGEVDKISNFKNPYDYVGQYHNEGLLKIMLSEDVKTFRSLDTNIVLTRSSYSKEKQILKEFIFKSSTNFSMNKFNLTTKNLKVDYIKMQNKLFPELYTRNFDSYSSSMEDLLQNELYQSCLKIIENECGSITEKDNTERINKINNEIILIEDKIYNSLEIKEKDKIILLMGTSVLKHSFEFWLLNPDLLMGQEISTRSAMPHWLNKFYNKLSNIAIEDAKGAVGGAVWTAATGIAEGSLVFGPGGAVVTVAGGAVGGAIAGSAIGAIM